MKFKIFLLSLFLSLPVLTYAETFNLNLQVRPQLAGEVCPSPVWKNTEIFWQGVIDKRDQVFLGSQQKKNQEPAQFVSQPPLETVFNTALQSLLQSCGMKFVSVPTDSSITLHVEIDAFYADVEKKVFTGKGSAQSHLTVIGERSNQTSMLVEIGYSIDSKVKRQKNVRQLESTLNELFNETLKQFALSSSMRELIK